MADRPREGVLDTCTFIELELLEPAALPEVPELTTITFAELHHGVAMTKDPAKKAARTERLGLALVGFEPLPFTAEAAARYGTLVAIVVAMGRDPRPRKIDLMIAGIASAAQLPLYTRNPHDFRGLGELVEVVSV